jgi:hypothetical protein
MSRDLNILSHIILLSAGFRKMYVPRSLLVLSAVKELIRSQDHKIHIYNDD